MRKILAVSAVLSLLSPLLLDAAGGPGLFSVDVALAQDESSYVPYSPDQLENLLAPIALYPDPLLAQVLPAATFVDQIDEAARYVRAYDQDGIDDQPWDVSVRAVAHYPEVLYMMDDKLDWTTAVGQAYVNQSTDVMEAVQRLRAMANAQGNLVSTPEQEVINDGGYFQIWPANPQFLYVPVYDPAVIFFQQVYFGVGGWFGGYFAFSDGFAIGAWLNRDCDWHRHRVFYTGWRGGGWIGRSRPHVKITNVYVNNRFINTAVNRTVIKRRVNVANLDRFSSVHRNVTFNNVARDKIVEKPNNRVNNRVINRNLNMNDPRLDQFRGRESRAESTLPSTRSRVPFERSAPRPSNRPPSPPPAPRPQYQPSPRAFGLTEGGFDPRISSQRGQSSRAQKVRPSVPSRAQRARPSVPSRPASPSRRRP
jgi:Protein of unknown function (DUF3300)